MPCKPVRSTRTVQKPKPSINSAKPLSAVSVHQGHPYWTGKSQGCGKIAADGLSIDGQPLKCRKHGAGFCIGQKGIRFVNGKTVGGEE